MGWTRAHLESVFPVANDKVTVPREKEKLSPQVGNKRLTGEGTPKPELLPLSKRQREPLDQASLQSPQ